MGILARRRCAARRIDLLLFELIARQPGAARVADFLLARLCLDQIARKLAAGAPQIDLKGERVLAGPAVEHPVERRIGDEPTVPILLTLDLGRREAGRQRAARHHVRRADLVGGAVEVDEVASANIDGADTRIASRPC